jgi:hypothetical protein
VSKPTRLDCTDDDAQGLRALIDAKPDSAVAAAKRTATLASWVKTLLDDRTKLCRRERALFESNAGLIAAVKSRDASIATLREQLHAERAIVDLSIQIRDRYADGFNSARSASVTGRWRQAIDIVKERRTAALFNPPRVVKP